MEIHLRYAIYGYIMYNNIDGRFINVSLIHMVNGYTLVNIACICAFMLKLILISWLKVAHRPSTSMNLAAGYRSRPPTVSQTLPMIPLYLGSALRARRWDPANVSGEMVNGWRMDG